MLYNIIILKPSIFFCVSCNCLTMTSVLTAKNKMKNENEKKREKKLSLYEVGYCYQ